MSIPHHLNVVCSRTYGDTYHLADSEKTLCGRDATEMPILPLKPMVAHDSAYTCKRCQKKLNEILREED